MSGQNIEPTSIRLAESLQRRAHTPIGRFNRVRLDSLVEVLNVWNDLKLGLERLNKTEDGHVLLVFANAEAAETARDRIFPKGCGQTAILRSKRLSFIVPSDQLGRLVYLLPQKKLQEKGIDFAGLEKAFSSPDENFEILLSKFLMGDKRETEREKILYKEFKEKFKRHCLDKLSPVDRFNADFFPACFERGSAIPRPVKLDFIQRAQIVRPDSAYPGQMVLEFTSQEDCEKFIELERERAKEKGLPEALWVKPEASGRVMTLDLRRFFNLYPDETETNETKFSSRSDFKDYLDKVRPGIRAEFVSYLNNLLAVSAKTYRFLDAHFHAPAGSKPDQYRMRFYVSKKADAEEFLTDIYGIDEDKPRIVRGHKGSYYVDILPPRIYRLLDGDLDAREFYDRITMPEHRGLPLDVFKRAMQEGKEKEKSRPYFEALVEQAFSAVNTTGKKSLIRRFFRALLMREDTRLSVEKVSVNADANTVKFSLSAFEETSLETFRQICLDAGCPYAKDEMGSFVFSVADIERLTKYLDEHSELIGEKRPLDFSTLRLHEELTYFETVLRFQSAIDDAAKTHKEGVSDDAYAKAQALYERIRSGYAHREYLYQEFRPEEGNHRLFSQQCEHDVWQLQQVKPDAKHPTVITVACATRQGAQLSNYIILDTLKKAIVAELFKSHLEGQKGQIDVKLDITDRRGDKVSEAMQKRIIELAQEKDFTLKELGITEEMVKDNCGGEKISLGSLYLDGDLVNSKLDARDHHTDTQYALPEGVDTRGVHLGVESIRPGR